MRALYAQARHAWVFLNSADRQWPMAVLGPMAAAAEAGADFVIGVRSNKREVYTAYRRLVSWGYERVVRAIGATDATRGMPPRRRRSPSLRRRGAPAGAGTGADRRARGSRCAVARRRSVVKVSDTDVVVAVAGGGARFDVPERTARRLGAEFGAFALETQVRRPASRLAWQRATWASRSPRSAARGARSPSARCPRCETDGTQGDASCWHPCWAGAMKRRSALTRARAAARCSGAACDTHRGSSADRRSAP